MIEILNTYDQNTYNEDLKPLKQLPRNVRQIGEINSSKKIYLEDYVYTYLYQYASSNLESPQIAILLGHYYKHESNKILLISGAVQAEGFLSNQSEVIFTNETWSLIYDKIKEFFDNYEIVGWMFSRPGYSININEQVTKVHTSNFPGSEKVLYMIDPIEKEDAFYTYEHHRLIDQEGYYIYYERNETMHQYMLDNRIVEEKKEPEPEEVVASYRRHVQSRKQEVYHRKLVNMLYVTSGALAIIVLVIGIALMNNYDKMKNLETTLHNLTQSIGGGSQQSKETEEQPQDEDSRNQEEQDTDSTSGQEVEEDPQASNQESNSSSNSSDVGTTIPIINTNPLKTYTVQKGDTLAQICMKFYNSTEMMREIQNINNISNPNKIYVGQNILLPQP